MKLEKLVNDGEGYLPLVLTLTWQMAQLNYAKEQDPYQVKMLDRHTFTDETFTLIKGNGLLVTYEEGVGCELTPLEWGCTYNVPEMMWHNIVMSKGSCILITESRDAHLKGFDQISMPMFIQKKIVDFTETKWKENEMEGEKEK